MLKNLKRVFALILVLSVCISCVGVSINAFADSDSQAILDEIERLNKESQALQQQINEKKASLKDQNAIKSSIESQINNTQKKIDACNRYIEQCQAEIRESENKIAESNSKIESTKERFKKRIRSLYNSNSGSNVQVLLGAESFADFLTLSELSQNISAQDNKMVDELVTAISSIQEEIKKNEELKAKQAEIKKTLAADRSVLDAQVADVNKVINQINSSKNNLQAEQNALKAQMEEYENALLYGSVSSAPFDGVFRWPVPGFPMTCPFMSNDSVHKGNHKGIDLGSWGINNKPIQCSATGVVTTLVNYCTHNYGKSGSCGCGGGYGNHVQVSHGKHNGYYYTTIYAHMRTAIVSQGQAVSSGQILGYVGSTGWSTGWHLHFGIARGTSPNSMQWVNPMNFKYINR